MNAGEAGAMRSGQEFDDRKFFSDWGIYEGKTGLYNGVDMGASDSLAGHFACLWL